MKPVPISKDELLGMLDEIRQGVESGDTLEGSFEFTLPFPPAGDPEDAEFMARASYRIGNLMGQGGVRMLGELDA